MELLHLAIGPSSLREPATMVDSRTLHRGLSVDLNAPPVSFSANSLASSSNSKWIKKPIGDYDGLSAPSSLELSNTHLPSNVHTLGCFPGPDYCRIGRGVYRLGLDCHALPPKKLRRLLTTFSDGVHVFSCVERVGMSTPADFEWPTDGFNHMHPFLSKKRPWQVCGLTQGGCKETEDANAGFLGLTSLYQRLTNPDMLHDGDTYCVQDMGSGGSANGGGHGWGGDGDGNDGFGPEQPGSEIQGLPITTNWHASVKEQEDGAMQNKGGVNDMDIASVDTNNTGIRQSLSEKEDVTMSRNEGGLLDCCKREKACASDVPYHVLYKALEELGKAICSIHSEFKRILCYEKTHMDEANSNGIPMWQFDVHLPIAAQSDDHGELQAGMQDVDVALANDSFASDIDKKSKDLLEKLRGLTLGSVEPLNPRAEQIQTNNPVRMERDEGLKPEEATGGNTRDTGRQLQGVVDWLGRLAGNVSRRHGGNQERFEKDNLVEDEKLKTMVNEAVAIALKQVSDATGSPTLDKHADMETLRRLQREVFSELLKLREGLDQMASVKRSDGARSLPGAGKTNLKGEVKVGTAFVMLEDSSSRHSRGSLEQAGMQTGVDVRLTFETPFREKDMLITECVAGQGSTVGEGRALGGPMSLGKVHYLAHINDAVSISVVPIGAQGMDVTDIVNPMQDQGLTAFSSRGPTLFDHCKGSAIGATWSGSSFAFSAAQYLSGWGNQTFSLGTDTGETGPLCLSTLGQVLLQPTECLIFSLSGLNRFWPSPPLPSSMGLHWSEMGPLVIPKIQSLQTSKSTMSSEDSFLSHCNSLSSRWGMLESEYHLDAPEGKGTSLLSVAAASEMEISEGMSVGAWAQLEMGDVLQDLDKGNFQWALNLAKTSKSGVDWGVSIGGSRPDLWSISTSDQEMYPGFVGGVGDSYGPQLHLEAFLKFNCGKGFTLQPGLLYLLNKHTRTPAFVVRSNWFF
eukprot:c1474_g1_i1 orf=172-3072(-)